MLGCETKKINGKKIRTKRQPDKHQDENENLFGQGIE